MFYLGMLVGFAAGVAACSLAAWLSNRTPYDDWPGMG